MGVTLSLCTILYLDSRFANILPHLLSLFPYTHTCMYTHTQTTETLKIQLILTLDQMEFLVSNLLIFVRE